MLGGPSSGHKEDFFTKLAKGYEQTLSLGKKIKIFSGG
jgi:hypothetical protein